MFHILTFRSATFPPEANWEPSGDQETELVPVGCPAKVHRGCHVSVFQIKIARSAEANCEPSGDHATEFTDALCPVSVWSPFPVVASQILTVRSTEPEAIIVPLGD